MILRATVRLAQWQINPNQCAAGAQFLVFWAAKLAYIAGMEQLIDQFPQGSVKDVREAVGKLRGLIEGGAYSAGDRLPSEREMIAMLDIRRNTLRKALDTLERDGVIWRHVGKGTFLAKTKPAPGFAALADLSRNLTPVRTVQARLCIEPALAREAAIHASRDAISRINQAKDAARSAIDWADYEEKDDQFHRAVAASSDNALLLMLFEQLNYIRRAVADSSVVRGTSRPTAEHSSFAEHERIAEAIAAHDPSAAQAAMRAHIGSVSDRLFGD